MEIKRAHSASFAGSLFDEELDDLRRLGALRRFGHGDVLLAEGQPSERVVVVLSGQAKVSSRSHGGHEVVLGVRGPGDLMGELSVLDGAACSASVSALGPLEALVVPSEAFEGFLQHHPRVAFLVLRTISRRLRDADRKRVEFGRYDAPTRVARRLVELADEYGEQDARGVRVSISLTQDDLAGWTGASREAVGRALRAFRSSGWIETGRRSVLVLDREALRSAV